MVVEDRIRELEAEENIKRVIEELEKNTNKRPKGILDKFGEGGP